MAETTIQPTAERALVDQGTVGGDLASPPALSATRVQAQILTEDIGGGRSEVREIHETYNNLHKRSRDTEWRIRTIERAKASVPTMLKELAEQGFAWRDIARLVGVTVPAVQKWRRGEGVSGDKRLAVASLLAACDEIAEHYMVDEIASWFEMPLVSGVPVTPIDLYAASRPDLVFEFAGGHVDPEILVTQFDPEWRERYRSDFETFEAPDGQRSIRMKD